MENDLDARELVRVVAEEEEAIVIIQMFMQQRHDCINNHFDDISFFNQLSGLEEDGNVRTSVARCKVKAMILNDMLYLAHSDAPTTNNTHQCGDSEDLN